MTSLAEEAAALDPEASKPITLDEVKGVKRTLVEEAKALESVQQEKPQEINTNPAEGRTWQENLAAGVGMGATKIAHGAKQLLDIPATYLEKEIPRGLSKWAESHGLPSAEQSAEHTNENVAELRKLNKPLEETFAGMAGDIAGQIAGTMLPLGMAGKVSAPARAMFAPTTYKAAAAAGGLQGALQPTVGNESKALNTAVGVGAGMGGNAAVNAIGRVAQPITQVLDKAHKKAIETLTNAGIPLDAAQKTGSAFLNKVRSSFWDNPFTAGGQSEMAQTQQKGFNKAVLKTVGENAESATPEVMQSAEKRINGVFRDVLDRNNVEINDTVLSKIGDIQQKAAEEDAGAVVKIANRLINKVGADGKVSGQEMYNIRRDLARISSNSQDPRSYHAKQLENAVMDAIHSSLDSADKKAFAEARGQFSNLRRIEGTLDKTGQGDISPARLANVMAQKRNRSASIYGRGPQELVDLAHSGNMLLPDKAPQSGSVPRAIMQLGLPLAAGAGEAAYSGGDLKKAGLMAGSVYLLPKAAQFAMNNPAASNYLTEGMRGGMTPLRDFLTIPQNYSAVGGALKRIPSALIGAQHKE